MARKGSAQGKLHPIQASFRLVPRTRNSHTPCRKRGCELRVQKRGTRIIDLPVPTIPKFVRIRGPRGCTNSAIGTLVSARSGDFGVVVIIAPQCAGDQSRRAAVSYTHLTLPTSDL